MTFSTPMRIEELEALKKIARETEKGIFRIDLQDPFSRIIFICDEYSVYFALYFGPILLDSINVELLCL